MRCGCARSRSGIRRSGRRNRMSTIGVEAVVTVVRPQAGCAIVLAAGRKRRAMEGIDRGAVLGYKRDVDRALRPFAGREPEVGLSIIAKANVARAAALLRRDLHGDPIAQRGERLEV